jgi:hypothetical protein
MGKKEKLGFVLTGQILYNRGMGSQVDRAPASCGRSVFESRHLFLKTINRRNTVSKGAITTKTEARQKYTNI